MALAISLRPLRDTRQRRERGTLAISPWACNRHRQAGDLAGLLFWLFGEREWSPSEL